MGNQSSTHCEINMLVLVGMEKVGSCGFPSSLILQKLAQPINVHCITNIMALSLPTGCFLCS